MLFSKHNSYNILLIENDFILDDLELLENEKKESDEKTGSFSISTGS